MAASGIASPRTGQEGVSADPRRVQSIVERATPTSCTDSEARRFTGLANYYSLLAWRAAPSSLRRGRRSAAPRFVRSPDAQASLDALKRALSSAPALRTFDPSRAWP